MTSKESLAIRRERAVPRGVASTTTYRRIEQKMPSFGMLKAVALSVSLGGIAVLNACHGHPAVIDAVQA